MKVTKDKASATLTDVKNKIGDVFSLVDDFGEVTITSYNKPAYKIVKIPAERKAALKKEQKEETNSEADEAESATTETEKKAVTASAKASVPAKEAPAAEPELPETPPADEVVDLDVPVAADIPTPNAEPEPEDTKVEQSVTNFQPPTEFAGLLQEEVEQSVTITATQEDQGEAIGTEGAGSIVETIAKSNKPLEPDHQVSHSGSTKEWDRAGHLEQDWVQKVRNLL